jgi:hypothetical protein
MKLFGRCRLFSSIIGAMALFFLLLASVRASQVTLSWSPVLSPILGGYRIHYGLNSRNYLWTADAGNQTEFTIYNLAGGQTYYFAATAYNNTITTESGYSNEVSVAIPSDDPSGNSGNSGNSGFLIALYYQSIFGRSPDANGIIFWQSEIDRTQGLGIDIEESFRLMASLFFASDEYIGKNPGNNQYVTDLYRTFLNRSPDAGGLNYWLGQLAAGLPRSVVMYSFMFMPEFSSYMQGLLGNTGSRGEVAVLVDFYRGFFNRLPDSSGFSYWLARFRSAQCRGSSAVVAEVDNITRQFLASQEYANRSRNDYRDYVTDLYFAFLRRGGDLSGFEYWVSQLSAGLRSRDQIRQDFIQTPEFQARVQQIIKDGCLN